MLKWERGYGAIIFFSRFSRGASALKNLVVHYFSFNVNDNFESIRDHNKKIIQVLT